MFDLIEVNKKVNIDYCILFFKMCWCMFYENWEVFLEFE